MRLEGKGSGGEGREEVERGREVGIWYPLSTPHVKCVQLYSLLQGGLIILNG